jgi:ribonuclease P protein component
MTGQDHSGTEVPGEQFPAAARLKKQFDFDAVFAGNRFAADETLVVTATRTSHSATRLGLSIGRQVGNAVVRNRWKRLIREAFRRNRSRIPRSLDLVVRPRKGAVCSFERVVRSLLALTKRLERDLLRGQQSPNSPAPSPSAQSPPAKRPARPALGEGP